MSEKILFDNFLLTDDHSVAIDFAKATFAIKVTQEGLVQKSESGVSFVSSNSDSIIDWYILDLFRKMDSCPVSYRQPTNDRGYGRFTF
jgi:hypothetical protein